MTVVPEDAPALFDAAARARLLEWAEVLMPATDGMPTVAEAGVGGPTLDQALRARPDHAAALLEALQRTAATSPEAALATLRQHHPALWEAVTLLLPAAYLLDPEVRRRLGYAGQGPQPIAPDAPLGYEDLIDAVIRRGPTYRPTPDRTPPG